MDMDGVSERKMSILQSDVIESFLDIDEILGHKELRYFGNRFRRVTYTVNNILISAENAAHLQISIHYPADWSSKKHGQVSQPHLSTVDAAYLASALGEWYKHRIYEIDETQDSNLQLISCEIFSGVTPDENLINLKAEVNELGCEKLKSKRSLFKARSDLSIQLGSMKINIAFAHSGKKREHFYSIYDSILDGKNYKYTQANNEHISGLTRMEIKHVKFSKDTKIVLASLILESSSADYRDLSLVEVVLASAQLAQAVIYKVDDIDRSKSNTLWMRDFFIEQAVQFKVKQEQQIKLGGFG